MKTFKLISLISLFILSVNAFSQNSVSFSLKVEKQAMSTPMTPVDEIFFMSYYYTKPMNVDFNGATLKMYYDNGATFAKKEVTEVNREEEFEDGKLAIETIFYTNNANLSDTISLVFDYNVGYIQVILPTTNKSGEYIGYTSYRQFVEEGKLAMN
ncbi:MAG TPA: hypothetical protein VJY41_01545 [Prolixibacteraceae bacterium]|nr:hypothetical protein [Prolixibacteraceae bacterium]